VGGTVTLSKAARKEYIQHPEQLPEEATARWFVLCRIREMADRGELARYPAETLNHFLLGVPEEHRLALLVDRVQAWAELGVVEALLATLRDVTGL
jgi:hypothetical protein